MLRTGQIQSRRNAALCLLLALAVLAVSLLLYSPWHLLGTYSTRACAFTQFEHGGCFEPPAQISIAPPARHAWHGFCDSIHASVDSAELQLSAQRAPPLA